MPKTSRNTPCPCRSGAKFKRCCLPKIEAPPKASGSFISTLEWLAECYPLQCMDEMFKQFYGLAPHELFEPLESLPDHVYAAQNLNALEWLLAEADWRPEARLESSGDGDEPLRFVDFVLFEMEGRLSADHCERLEMLSRAPIRLYEVSELVEGRGLWLEHVGARRDHRPFYVEGAHACNSVAPRAIVGARLLPTEPPSLSGCLYTFNPMEYIELQQAIARLETQTDAAITRVIINKWLRNLLHVTYPTPIAQIDRAFERPREAYGVH